MSAIFPALRITMSVLAICTTVGLTAYLWRWRSVPTAQPLLGVTTSMLAATVIHLVVVDLSAPDAVYAVTGLTVRGTVRTALLIDFYVLMAAGWFLFVLQYTGRARRLLRASVGIFGALFLVSVATTAALVRGAEATGPVFQFINLVVVLAAALMTVGVLLMITASIGQNPFPFREPLVLSAGAVVLVFGVVLFGVLSEPIIFPLMAVVSVGLFAWAVSGAPTFEMLPAAHVAGRDRIIERMNDAVVVIDREERVRDLNPAGAAMLKSGRDTALGRPLSELLPTPVDIPTAADADEPFQTAVGDRTFTVTANRITDERDRWFGYLLVCEDVTERQVREQRLTVLNSLLSRAVRDRMTGVADDAERIEAGEIDPAPAGERIWSTTTDLTSLVASARDVERAIAERETGPTGSRTDVGAGVERLVARWSDPGGPSVDVTTPGDPVFAGIHPRLLGSALATLVDATARAGGEPVEIRVSAAERGPAIRVGSDALATDGTDNADGPAIDRLPIAIARLAIEHAGGEVTGPVPDDEVTGPDPGDEGYVRCQLPPVADTPGGTEGGGETDVGSTDTERRRGRRR